MNDPRQLIEAYLDEQLDEAQAGELQRWLAADRANLRNFLRATALHRGLRREFVGAAARHDFAAAEQKPTRANAKRVSSRRLSLRRRSAFRWQQVGLAAAACLLVGLGVLLLAPGRDPGAAIELTAGTLTVDRGGPSVPLRGEGEGSAAGASRGE